MKVSCGDDAPGKMYFGQVSTEWIGMKVAECNHSEHKLSCGPMSTFAQGWRTWTKLFQVYYRSVLVGVSMHLVGVLPTAVTLLAMVLGFQPRQKKCLFFCRKKCESYTR